MEGQIPGDSGKSLEEILFGVVPVNLQFWSYSVRGGTSPTGVSPATPHRRVDGSSVGAKVNGSDPGRRYERSPRPLR